MKSTDLRIGNYTDKGQIKSFYETGIHAGLGKCYGFETLSPIPLTEEILLKCGFSVVDDNPKQKPHYEGDILFSIAGHEFSNSSEDGFYSYSLNESKVIYKYIHELQNLYYALTSQELEIQL